MSHLPNRDGRHERDEPLWAVDPVEPAWEDPTPAPQARAWFSVAERRFNLPTRIASRAAGLIAVGALMTTGVAIAAFADDGTGSAGDKPFCSEVITTECVDKDKEKTPPASSEESKPAEDPAPAPAAEPDPPAASAEEAAPAEEPAASTADDAPASDPATSDPAPADGGAPASSDDPAPAGSDAPASGPTNDTGTPGDTGSTATTDAPTATSDAPAATTADVPATNPLPPAPAGTTPTTTVAGTSAPGDLSALAGLESSAGSTYFQLPSGRTSGSSATGHTGGVAGGLSDSGGANDIHTNDIHAVGISALALLQLQRASSLLPPPAPLPDIRELDARELTLLRNAAKRTGVGWTVLASAQRLGLRKGQSLTAAGKWLKSHGATANSAKPFASEKALAAYLGSKDAGERAAALAAYYWAVGTTGVTRGLADASITLGTELLAAKQVSIYGAGRADLQQNRIDPRVEMTIRYLQASFGSVSVSSLITGHGVFTTSGNVSAHIFGRAVDIAAVGDTPILGHQGPRTVTERAVRLLLMLPGDIAPRQIISLMDLDGTTGNAGSFALPDHADHIHIGY
ncbi:MAG: hypothetical protein QOJ57_1469 [Thermoleophilaceae bacterium]|nr:hypothetical protein [Thermoleophilaceae bacterium]